MAGPWEDYQRAAGPRGPWDDFAPPSQVAPNPRQVQDIGDAILHGLQSSSLGLAVRGKLPSQQLGEDAPWYHRIASGVGGIAGDIPAGVAGGVAGIAAGAPAGPAGASVGGFAGAFAVPMALREALIEAYSNDHAVSWEGAWDIALAALKGGGKGAVIGAATGGAGLIAGRALGAAIAPSIGTTIGTRTAIGAIESAAAGSELAVLTTTSAALEGHMPTWQDFMDNAILLGGTKVAFSAAKGLQKTYVRTGKLPQEVLADAQADKTIRPALEKMEVPEAYRTLETAERIKAALDKDNGKDVIRAFEAQAKGEADPLIKGDLVRYEYLTSAEDVQQVIRVTAEAYKDQIEAQRRGVVPTKASILEGLDLARSGELAKAEVGRADAPHEAVARAVLTRDAAVRARRLLSELDDLAPQDRTPMKMLEAQAAVQQLSMFYGELAGGVAEAARTLRMMREIKQNPALLGEAEHILRAYEKNGKGIGDLAALARVINDPAQFAKAASKIMEATTLEKVLEVYRANLFSGLLTHEANLMGNTMKWLVEVPESSLAAALFAVGEMAHGRPIAVSQVKARALAPVMGFTLGAKDGVIAAAEALRQRDIVNSKAEQFRLANTGAVGMYTGTVFGALQAGDMLFRIPAERARAYVLAVDRAVKEGWNPDTAEGRATIARYTNEPTMGLTQKVAEKVTAEIQQAGAEAVFGQRLGPRMEKAQYAISGSLAQFIFPAFRTPVNLLSWAVQHTPGLNLLSARWRADFAAGGERQAQATARVLIGTGIATLAYTWAQDGVITGSGAFDKEMGPAKRAAGWQPNSIKIGNEYYSFERMEPIAKLFTVAADLVDIARVTKDEEDKAKIFALLMLAFGNATVSTTYLSGLANTMKAITDPERYGEYFAEGYAAGLVPKIIGQSVTMADENKREVDGVLDAIQSQIPFIREKLLPKRDVWGEPVTQNRWFAVMPVTVTTESTEKVRTEAARLEFAISDAPRYAQERGPLRPKEERVRLTEEQRDIFRQVSGKAAMEILRPIVNAPDWDRIPDFAKVAIYKRVIEGARKQGDLAALPPDAAERVKLREKIVDKVLKQVQGGSGEGK